MFIIIFTQIMRHLIINHHFTQVSTYYYNYNNIIDIWQQYSSYSISILSVIVLIVYSRKYFDKSDIVYSTTIR